MKTLVALAVAVFVLFPTSLEAAPAKPALEVLVLGCGGPRAFLRPAAHAPRPYLSNRNIAHFKNQVKPLTTNDITFF